MRYAASTAALCVAMLCSHMPTAYCDESANPAWVQAALEQMVRYGYLDSAGDVSSCTREEVAQTVARALSRMDDVRGTAVMWQDAEGIAAGETETEMGEVPKAYEKEWKKAFRSTERLLRQSILGQNLLDKMQSYRDEAEKDQQQLEQQAEAYAAGIARQPNAEQAGAYGRLTRLTLVDEVQLKLAGEQEKYARKQYRKARRNPDGDTAGTAHNLSGASARVSLRREMLASDRARQERIMAVLQGKHTDRAEPSLGQQADGSPGKAQDVNKLASQLRAEYLSELYAMGYLDEEAAFLQSDPYLPVENPPDPRLRIDAELRFDSGYSNGEEGNGNTARLRARIYPDYNIDGNWHAIGMIEMEKYLSGGNGGGQGATIFGDDNSHISFDRYYLQGKIGVLKTTFGAYGTEMAEGNIYDTKFKGLRFETEGPVSYRAEFGRINNRDSNAFDFVATYAVPDYTAQAGVYRFNDINGASRTIGMLNYRQPVGKYDAGVMLLTGRDEKAGNGTGVVATISQGQENSWKKGSSAWWLKYYRQPSSTYVAHTMNGMADYMSHDMNPLRGGFQGFGVGYSYTLAKDLVFSLEYYSLTDLWTRKHSQTIWGSLTGYFRNYDE